MFHDPEFFAGIAVDREAADFVRDLCREGAQVHIVTHRDHRPEDREVTARWLALWAIPYTRLEFRKSDEKPAYAGRWELDYFIEDHPKTSWSLATEPSIHATFIRDKPYNRNAKEHRKLSRFYRWAEMRKFFRI
jgi:uncharacterized HAD superfamily protein